MPPSRRSLPRALRTAVTGALVVVASVFGAVAAAPSLAVSAPPPLKATALSAPEVYRSATASPAAAEDWDLVEAFGDASQGIVVVSAEEMQARAEAVAQAERERIEAERREQGLSGWVDPLQGKGRFTSAFGPRVLNGVPGVHEGIDLAAPVGTPIVAAFDGEVVYTGLGGGGWGLTGWVVAIEHDTPAGSFVTTYNHMYADGVLVKVGQEVLSGDLIARVGNEGNSTGAHLHFSTRVPATGTGTGWTVVDPVEFMAERDVDLRDR